jgi:general secretion pathway protein L
MAQRILGLDLGASAVKAVLLESSFHGFSVIGTAMEPLPPSTPEPGAPWARHAAALRALLSAQGWHFDSALVAFPGTAAASHLVTLPFSDQKRIEQTVQFEVEAQIPFDLAEVSWDWQPLGTRDGRSDLYVGVVRRDDLAGLLGVLGGAGIDPRAVVPAGPALASLFEAGVLAGEAAAPGSEAAAEVLLDIGHERSSVCVVAGGHCEGARTFAAGSAPLARALARDLSIGEPEALALLAAEGGGAELPPDLAARAREPAAAAALRRALVPLARELRSTIKAWEGRGRRPVRRLLLAGQAARLPGLAELLAPEVGAPVELVSFQGGASAIPAADAPALALALALALRGHQGSRASRLNLRRGDLAYTRDFEHLRGKVIRLATFAGLVVLLALVSSGVKVFALARQEALLDKALCDATQRLVGKCYDNFETAEAVLKGRGTPAAAIPRISAVNVFAELAARTPLDVPLKFDRMEITREKLHLAGTTDAAENVDKIVAALRGSRCFAEARSGGARRRASDAKFEFSIDADLGCEGPAAPGGKG